MSEAIVFTSAKDGVGKTVLATNMATILANWGYRVLLIDMNIGSRNMDIRLGMENEVVYDLADIITGVCRIKQGIVQDKRIKNLHFITAPQDKNKVRIDERAFGAFVGEVKKVFDYILIDSPAINSLNFDLVVSAGDKSVIVVIPEFGSVRDIEPIKLRLRKLDKDKVFILVNKEFPDLTREGLTPSQNELSDLLDLPALGTIYFDEEIHKWANKGSPMAQATESKSEERKIIRDLNDIAHRLISEVNNLTADTNI